MRVCVCVCGGGGGDSKQCLQIQTRKFATYLCCPIKIRWCFIVVCFYFSLGRVAVLLLTV